MTANKYRALQRWRANSLRGDCSQHFVFQMPVAIQHCYFQETTGVEPKVKTEDQQRELYLFKELAKGVLAQHFAAFKSPQTLQFLAVNLVASELIHSYFYLSEYSQECHIFNAALTEHIAAVHAKQTLGLREGFRISAGATSILEKPRHRHMHYSTARSGCAKILDLMRALDATVHGMLYQLPHGVEFIGKQYMNGQIAYS